MLKQFMHKLHELINALEQIVMKIKKYVLEHVLIKI